MKSGLVRYISKKAGFSLAEMSVVLAAVAAVVVVTAGGASLVNKARLGDIVNDVRDFSKAVTKFETQYNGIPGDIAVVTSIPGTNTAGNGNGAIDSAAEALNLWRQLGQLKLIKGTYDGTSTYVPGKGVPEGSIKGSGYNVLDPASVSGVPNQAVIIEIAGFSASANNLSVLTPEDAKSIDSKADDGNPTTGYIRATGSGAGGNCVTSSAYTLTNKTLSCRLQFIIFGGEANQDSATISGTCTQIGATRITNPSGVCDVGYLKKAVQTCRIDPATNTGSWVTTSKLCEPLTCSGGKKFGDTRTVSCINNMTGSITQTCSSSGIWTITSDTCVVPDGVTACSPSSGQVRAPQACSIDRKGNALQICSGGVWTTTSENCTSPGGRIQCSAPNSFVGGWASNTAGCGDSNNWAGTASRVCTVAGAWVATAVENNCYPKYTQNCPSVGTIMDIGCPPGETGEHKEICTKTGGHGSAEWIIKTDTCKPITCDGGENIGEYRIKQGAVCPLGQSGTVFETCDGSGAWATSYSNCVSTVCNGALDTAGFATWTNQAVSSTATGSCIAGYQISGSAPTRTCNADSTWSSTVTNPCVRSQCAAGSWGGATWSAADSNTQNINGQCNWPQLEGSPVADCSSTTSWTNMRAQCAASKLPVLSGLTFWVDAADPSTVYTDTSCTTRAGNGNSVQCWKDKSGQALNVTYTAGTAPTIVSSGQGGLPVVRFPNSTGLSRANVPLSSLFVSNGATIITAARENATGAASGYLLSWNGGGANYVSLAISNAHFLKAGWGGEYSQGSYLLGAFNIITSRLNGTTPTLYLNGRDDATNLFFDVAPSGSNNIVIGTGLNGDVAEGLMYKRALSDTERYKVEKYLGDKWGVSVLPITTAPKLWLDSNDSAKLYTDSTCSTSASIGTNTIGCWRDKSPNNFNATQATGANQPTYQRNAINNRNIVRFDGSNDMLDIPYNASLNSQNFSIYSVAKAAALATNKAVFSTRDATNTKGYALYAHGSDLWLSYIGNGTTNVQVGSEPVYTNQPIIIAFNSTNAAQNFYVNNAKLYTGAAAYQTNTASLTRIGGGQNELGVGSGNFYFNGDISEILLYNVVNTANERASINAYLGDKWGISIIPIDTSSTTLWFDANDNYTLFTDTGCTTLAGGGNSVGCWKNKGKALATGNITQGTAGAQPTYQTAVQNNKPVLRLDGGDYLSTASVAGSNFFNANEITVSLALKNTAAGCNAPVSWGVDPNRFQTHMVWVDGTLYWDYGNAFTRVSVVPSGFVNNFNVVTLEKTTGNVGTIRVNGVTYATSSSMTGSLNTAASAIFRVGATMDAGCGWPGDIGEVIINSRGLTDAEVANVESYLYKKWGAYVPDPLPVMSGLDLWLDANDPNNTGIRAADGSKVSTWVDKGPNKYNMTQGSSSIQPTIDSDAMGGKPGLKFTGTQYLASTAAVAMNYTSQYTWMTAVKPSNVGIAQQQPFSRWNSGVSGNAGFYLVNNIVYGMNNISPFSLPASDTPMTTTRARAVATRMSASYFDVYVDGQISARKASQASQSDVTTPFVVGGWQLNSAYTPSYQGYIGEIIYYNRGLTDSEMALMNTYLNDKWGLTVWQPTDITLSGTPTLWFDANDATTLYSNSACTTAASAAGAVGCWTNKGTAGATGNMVQGTAANQPTYQTNVQNGKAVIRFDGSNDNFATSSVVGSSFFSANAVTWFFATKQAAAVGTTSVLFWDPGTSNRFNAHALLGTTLYWDYATCCGASGRMTYAPASYVGNFKLVTLEKTSGNVGTIRIDGTTNATNNSMNSALVTSASSALRMGTSNLTDFYNGDIAETLVYNYGLTTTGGVASVERYLADKYNVTIP